MKIGAHVSAAVSFDKAIDRAQEIGAEAVQIFVSGPTTWRMRVPLPEECRAFRDKSKAAGIVPAFFHGVYLINLGSPNPELVAKGVESLIKYQEAAALLGAAGTIFHVGSHKGQGFDAVLPQVVRAMHAVLEGMPQGVSLIIENSAGMGQSIGSSFGEMGVIIRAVGSERVQVCLDTQHCFANGYNVAAKGGLDAAMEEFDREIGLGRLVAVHANDSQCALEGGLDRHENIGEGHIGREGFEAIMAHPAMQAPVFLLEVPGFEGGGPDKRNVDILKQMRGS